MDLSGDFAAYEQMGPSLLAAQPLTPPASIPKPTDNWNTLYEHLESTRGALWNWRLSWWSHWARLAEYFKPRRYHWLITADRMNRGSAINDAIIDGNGTLAVNTCASGMWAGLTNPARPWIKLGPKDSSIKIEEDGQEWLNDLGEQVLTLCEGSNFYTIMAQAFEDLAVFGTAPITIYEDYEDIIRLYLPCAGEYYLKAGARFSIDTQLREFTLTVQQIVEQFGMAKCPDDVRRLFQAGGSSLSKEYVVCHMIEPNFALAGRDGKPAKIGIPGSMTFREIYWLKGQESPEPLSIRGFHDAPFFVLLWSRVSNDPYGRSPCMDALGDSKQVQRSTIRKGEFIEKLVRPPMGANAELKNEPASTLPGMTTYVSTADGKKGFWPLFEVQPAALMPLVQDIDMVNKRIDRALFVDVFMAITQMQGVEPRNEMELTKRDLERLQKLGPVINLVENALGQAIVRIIHILERRRMVRPMPQSLHGIPLKIGFESLMRLAQRSAESMAMKDTFATLGGLSSAAKAAQVPDPIRTFNLDKAARKYAIANNFPIDCIFTEDEVEKHDAARAEQVRKQKGEDQAPGAAMAGVQAAKTLSETRVPGGTALGALMGGGLGG